MSVHLAGHLSALWGRWLSASRLDGPPVRGAASGERLRGTARLLELCLARNIVPFWYPRVVDATAGGYRLHHDSRGRWLGPSTKGIVAQARTLWFFSRLARSDYGRAEHRRAASHGYRFLRERMWDERCGGFFWEVGADGAAATRTDKVLLGQAFGLYALSEYALATGDASAADLAHALFRRIEEARDPARDFYPEVLGRDWSPLPAPPPSDPRRAGQERLNKHLHLLEALTPYAALRSDSLCARRLAELVDILGAYAPADPPVRGGSGAAENGGGRVAGAATEISCGHAVEAAWLIVEACRAAGVAVRPPPLASRRLFDGAVRRGFDREKGGFFDGGPAGSPTDRADKVWWVQAEALVGALRMYLLTGEEGYAAIYLATLRWVVARQTDWVHGDWHKRIRRDGRTAGDKAGHWKTPYHNGRAILTCLELLKSAPEAPLARPG